MKNVEKIFFLEKENPQQYKGIDGICFHSLMPQPKIIGFFL